jgi:hypothetical protein
LGAIWHKFGIGLADLEKQPRWRHPKQPP